MKITDPGIYHIYNRGNNKQTIFFSHENYLYFLRKCRLYLKPVSDILAWCLMPNHFHFLINISDAGLKLIRSGGIFMPAITNGFRLLESSYAKGINKQLARSGSLFQQKTKAKMTSDGSGYSINAFHYIHQNPVTAHLANAPGDWPYSSFNDYAELRKGTLCNKQKAYELLNLNGIDFLTETMKNIDPTSLKHIL